jgi:hypothetical protein
MIALNVSPGSREPGCSLRLDTSHDHVVVVTTSLAKKLWMRQCVSIPFRRLRTYGFSWFDSNWSFFAAQEPLSVRAPLPVQLLLSEDYPSAQ